MARNRKEENKKLPEMLSSPKVYAGIWYEIWDLAGGEIRRRAKGISGTGTTCQ
jgi:hypothetical protein